MKTILLKDCYEYLRWMATEMFDPSDVNPVSYPCIVVYVHIRNNEDRRYTRFTIIYPEMFGGEYAKK